MTTISVVTPWLDHPELIPGYEASVGGAEVVVVDQASQAGNAEQIRAMVERLGGVYLRNERNMHFAHANNQGLAAATGDIVIALNNDIQAEAGWLDTVRRDVRPGVFVGPSMAMVQADGIGVAFLEGWCLAAYRDDWLAIGGWDEVRYPFGYCEDCDLCWRATRHGFRLRQAAWPIAHLSNTTSRTQPGAYDHYQEQLEKFRERVRHDRRNGHS